MSATLAGLGAASPYLGTLQRALHRLAPLAPGHLLDEREGEIHRRAWAPRGHHALVDFQRPARALDAMGLQGSGEGGRATAGQ